MSPLLVLLGVGIVLLVYSAAGVLPIRTRHRLARTALIVGIGIVLLLLVRVGLPWLAAAGAVTLAALRFVGPILLRLLPWLISLRVTRGSKNGGETEETRATASSQMTRTDALEVLGLVEGASDQDVREAYTALIKKVHPDRGGTAYLASRVNLARDVLLSKDAR